MIEGLTANLILEALDREAEDHRFPALDNGGKYLVNQRMTVHCDKRHWMIAFQTFDFNPCTLSLGDLTVQTFGNGRGRAGTKQLQRL